MKVIKLESEIKPILPSAKEVNIAVAIMTEYGLELLQDNVTEDCEVNLLIGIDLLTPLEVFKDLLACTNEKWTIKVFRKKAFFHPKLYLVNNGATTAFVGSGNFTKGGVSTHVELFNTAEGDDAEEFEQWFDQYFKMGEELSQGFIDEYAPLFDKAVEAQYNSNSQIRKLKRDLEISNNPQAFDLEACDFTQQYFKYDDYNAFTGNKPYSFAEEINAERKSVKETLFDLHDRIYPLIQAKGWDLHPHDMTDHIISSHQHGAYTSEDLGALWLHYGRSSKDLKEFKRVYGENQTSMYQMRLQVLVHASDICLWLRVGKNNGSIVDRNAFKQNMRGATYRDRFYQLIQTLPDTYSVTINHEDRSVRSFSSADELHDFVKEDDIRNEYFIIGRSYQPDDNAISDQNINNTIMGDFQLLYPIYLHIRTII